VDTERPYLPREFRIAIDEEGNVPRVGEGGQSVGSGAAILAGGAQRPQLQCYGTLGGLVERALGAVDGMRQ
jgi:hypothetical protein